MDRTVRAVRQRVVGLSTFIPYYVIMINTGTIALTKDQVLKVLTSGGVFLNDIGETWEYRDQHTNDESFSLLNGDEWVEEFCFKGAELAGVFVSFLAHPNSSFQDEERVYFRLFRIANSDVLFEIVNRSN